jgi:glycosyltransferase involved in cell wall biosynthesis
MEKGISLCMIIKNEEKMLEDCLNSVKDIVDEIIIVDTGSEDKSKEIAKKFTDKVFDYKWNNNFSDARNFSLSFATKEWILILDADERISNKDNKKIKELTNRNDADAYVFNWRDYTNDSRAEGWTSSQGDEYEESNIASGFYVSKVLRFFKNKREYLFEGNIHETSNSSIERNGGIILHTNIVIHHLGNLNREKFLNKRENYSELLKERLNKRDFKEKTEDYICYELTKELSNLKKYSEAEIYIKRAIEIDSNLEYIRALSSLYLIENKLEEAEKLLRELVEREPGNWGSQSNLGIIYSKKGEYNKAIRKFEKAINLNPNFASAYFNLGVVYKTKGKYNKAKEFFNKATNLNPDYKDRIKLN